MRHPIHVNIDPECPVAYIRYLPDDVPFDGTLALLRDPDGVVRDYPFCDIGYRSVGVHIDVTPDDDIIGFEIISIEDAKSVAIAREYAADNELAFPADLRAAAARSSAA
jgi:hypothetical protein